MTKESHTADDEEQPGGPRKTFFTWLPFGLTEREQDAYIAAESRRLGVGDNKLVVASWMEPQSQ
jgi:hypothetical protein